MGAHDFGRSGSEDDWFEISLKRHRCPSLVSKRKRWNVLHEPGELRGCERSSKHGFPDQVRQDPGSWQIEGKK